MFKENDMRSYLKEAIVIALAIVSLGFFGYCAVKDTAERERLVEVRGLSTRVVDADRSVWNISIGYSELKDGMCVYDTLENKSLQLKSFLLNAGFKEEELNLTPPSIEEYTEYYDDDKREKFERVTAEITVVSNNIDLVRKTIARQSEVFKLNIPINSYSWQNRVSYDYTKLGALKPEMIEKATKNARSVALKFANDSGSKLGKIKRASQGYFTIDDLDDNTPFKKKVRVVTNVEYYLQD